jgi:hypothetical protein
MGTRRWTGRAETPQRSSRVCALLRNWNKMVAGVDVPQWLNSCGESN